jgi:HEAT repeat protein
MPLFGPPDVEKMRARRDISGLIKAMDYTRDAKIRQAAATAVGEMGDKQAVEPLIAAFRDKHPVLKDRREAVAKALGKIGDLRAVKPLVSALGKDEDETVREAALGALRKFGVPAVKPLVSALSEDEDETAGEAVIEELIEFGVPAIDALVTELKNNVFRMDFLKGYRTREAVIKALLGIGPLCINALIDALEESGRAVGRYGEGTLDFQVKVRRERAAGFNVDRYGWGTDDGKKLQVFEEVLVAFGAHSAQPLVTKLREKA